MTRRDMVWRGLGAATIAVSYAAAQFEIGGKAAGIGYFLAAVAGIVLTINGPRVATVFRAERRGHALTAEAVHAARVRRQAARRAQDAR